MAVDLDLGVPLPSTGLRHELKALVVLEMRQLLIDALSDKVGHAYAVASGAFTWRELVMKTFGPMFPEQVFCHEFANVSFECLRRAWIDRYPEYTPGAFLDAVHIPKPLSDKEKEQEIDDNWVIEIASDERSMHANYEGSARIRKGPWLGERPTPIVPKG